MKTLQVVAAIITDEQGRVLATQRGYGEFKDGWEFPGGKIESGEDPEDALRREIREELAADIVVGERLVTVEHDYPAFHLTMHCYMCRLAHEGLSLREHEAARWLGPDALDSVQWLPADVAVVSALRERG